MRKHCFVLWMAIGCCLGSAAQQASILNSVSPKLRQFLSETPRAFASLTNCMAEAFSNRTVQLYYFYSDDEKRARASHYYPYESVVGILIRENQEPVDEFICLVFEAINSTGQERFIGVFTKAQSGQVSKEEFTREMEKIEFVAIKRAREVLRAIKLSSKQVDKSYYYKRLIDCPDDFDDFIAYSKKVSPHRDTTAEWAAKYDMLRAQSGKRER